MSSTRSTPQSCPLFYKPHSSIHKIKDIISNNLHSMLLSNFFNNFIKIFEHQFSIFYCIRCINWFHKPCASRTIHQKFIRCPFFSSVQPSDKIKRPYCFQVFLCTFIMIFMSFTLSLRIHVFNSYIDEDLNPSLKFAIASIIGTPDKDHLLYWIGDHLST